MVNRERIVQKKSLTSYEKTEEKLGSGGVELLSTVSDDCLYREYEFG